MAQPPIIADAFRTGQTTQFSDVDTQTLVQAVAERFAIPSQDWHRLKGNRTARTKEQVAIALTALMNDQTDVALAHLQQAVGWLDRSVSAPPCPSHGDRSHH